ncbi:MAG: hypothetical protein BHV69_10100 [Bacteroidales bacterium 52_46]|nr:MAG: hypothetical protein BHV69_10100 [Bacteroidales bacterium 52_46]
MNKDGYNQARRWGCLGIMIYMITVVTAIVLLCSCSRSVYVPVETVRHNTDTLRLTALRVDSVFMHDSIAVMLRGDTVYITKYRDRFRYRTHTDTVYKAVIDTARISVPYPVERQLSRWEQTKMDFGGMAIGGIAIAVCIAVIWLIKKFRK